ncbi:trichohyalin [Scaptodrosophila lebanonensis]|uniref:Cilia- and flagella-associated protein 45 n=1 Tax=Drosophila lebanonensis TaxID=7225 RepID=A0A6J2U053_DROLE|nr:trichohyalin [Scaptodrosophila lebanonensis]
MPLNCVPPPSLPLPVECYDKYGHMPYATPSEEKVYKSDAFKKMRAEQKSEAEEILKRPNLEQQRRLPPGTVPPRMGSKAPPTKQKAEGSKATHFHVLGRPWKAMPYTELTQNDLKRLRNARPKSFEDRHLQQERLQMEQQRRTDEIEDLRIYFRDIDEAHRARDRKRERDIALLGADVFEDKVKLEAKRLQVLHKALNEKYATDELVKNTKRVISDAKCSAIWSAQIAERKLLERVQEQHDHEMMRKNEEYNNSRWGTKDQKEETEAQRRAEFGEAVRHQISEHMALRFQADDRKKMEARDVRAAAAAYRRAETERSERMLKQRQEYREELELYVRIHKDFQRMLCEQERIDEQRALEYMMAKEKQLKQERKEKAAHDADISRRRDILYTIQQKVLDSQGNRDEMRYLMEREQLERKYREDERVEAEKRRRMELKLRDDRRQQIKEQHEAKACFYQKQEDELQMLAAQRAIFEERQKKEEEKLTCRRKTFHASVAKQIEDREKARRRRIEEENLVLERARLSNRERQEEINTVITVQLDELARTECVPPEKLRVLLGRVANLDKKRLGRI